MSRKFDCELNFPTCGGIACFYEESLGRPLALEYGFRWWYVEVASGSRIFIWGGQRGRSIIMLFWPSYDPRTVSRVAPLPPPLSEGMKLSMRAKVVGSKPVVRCPLLEVYLPWPIILVDYLLAYVYISM